MNEENKEMETPQTNVVVEAPEAPKEETPVESKEIQSLQAQKNHFKEKYEKAETERKVMEDKLNAAINKPRSGETVGVDALDFIKLGKKLQDYSDVEIDFATNYAKSKNPEAILEALDDEMVQLAIQSKREKVEKERKALAPNSTQSNDDQPRSMEEILSTPGMSMAEKEKFLIEQGLYVLPKQKQDRTNIGPRQ